MNKPAILLVGIFMLVFLVKGFIGEHSDSIVKRNNSTEYVVVSVLFALIILLL